MTYGSGAGTTRRGGVRVVAVHLVFIAAVVAIGGLLGASLVPGPWYDTLNQPAFTPPPWVFGPVWSVLYVLIGWVGARKVLYGGAGALWGAQLVANFCWTPVFFGLHKPGAALVVILVLWCLIVAFMVTEARRDRLSVALFVPYLVWVTLASAVNAGVVWLN